MLRLLQTILCWVARWALHRRYAVQVVGLEKLQELRGPTLVLPNHPGYIDPPLVWSHVRLTQAVRPVATTSMYRKPLLRPLMRLLQSARGAGLERAQPLGARSHAGHDRRRRGRTRTRRVFLIYPSGHVVHNGREEVGAARTAAEVLARCPQANVVLVRTRGLWGSMFTYARTGKAPSLAQCAVRGLAWMAANLIVFAPRRRVVITVEPVERDRLPAAKRETLNPFLEAWYNQEGPETPVFVPYHAWFGPRQYTFPAAGESAATDRGQIRRATIEAVAELLEERLGRPLAAHEKTAGTTLDELGLDSLDRMDLALQIEDRFGFRSPQVAASVGELWAVAEGLVAATDQAGAPVPALWRQPPRTRKPVTILADTIPEAFVRRALEDPAEPCVADRLSGTLDYRRLLVGSQLLAAHFRSLPGDAVGVLLPASVGADLAFFGLHLAGKLPVMLNWTTGPANLAHAVEKLALRRVISSRKLIDRLGIEVPAPSTCSWKTCAPESASWLPCGPCWPPACSRGDGCGAASPATRRYGGGPVHFGFREHAQGRAAEPPQPARQRTGLDRGAALDQQRPHAGLSAAFSQHGLAGKHRRSDPGGRARWCTTPIRRMPPACCKRRRLTR